MHSVRPNSYIKSLRTVTTSKISQIVLSYLLAIMLPVHCKYQHINPIKCETHNKRTKRLGELIPKFMKVKVCATCRSQL
jgi:hypothetical protein